MKRQKNEIKKWEFPCHRWTILKLEIHNLEHAKHQTWKLSKCCAHFEYMYQMNSWGATKSNVHNEHKKLYWKRLFNSHANVELRKIFSQLSSVCYGWALTCQLFFSQHSLQFTVVDSHRSLILCCQHPLPVCRCPSNTFLFQHHHGNISLLPLYTPSLQDEVEMANTYVVFHLPPSLVNDLCGPKTSVCWSVLWEINNHICTQQFSLPQQLMDCTAHKTNIEQNKNKNKDVWINLPDTNN